MRTLLREMQPLPPAGRAPEAASLRASLIIPAKNCAHALEATVAEAYRYLSDRFGGHFEIILVPNTPKEPGRRLNDDPSPEVAARLARKFSSVRVVPYLGVSGKGGAVREGFLASKGAWIFFTDADLPYELEFFDRAGELLRAGCGLVTANRRLETSVFDIPVSLLPLAYGRHRLGLLFNRLVRLAFPIRTTDTQAGIKAMTRELATVAFERLRCPGFFFDLELFLTAHAIGARHAELPVALQLNTEKSTVRVLRQGWLALWWLAKIKKGSKKGSGSFLRHGASYSGAPLGTRVFLALRKYLTPYETMAAALPPQGPILDLGSGHGLLALAIAAASPERRVLAIDHDVERIKLARKAGAGLANLRFETGDMCKPPAALLEATAGKTGFAGIAIIDALHYFSPDVQDKLIADAYQRLAPGGRLIAREVDPDGGAISAWNRLYERIATGIGFTRAEAATLHFRKPAEWAAALKRAGFEVSYGRCSSRLFSDILFVGSKP